MHPHASSMLAACLPCQAIRHAPEITPVGRQTCVQQAGEALAAAVAAALPDMGEHSQQLLKPCLWHMGEALLQFLVCEPMPSPCKAFQHLENAAMRQ